MLTILLPTRNEPSVGKVIDLIRTLGIGCDIIVVDYRSTDGTREAVIERGVTLIDEEEPGKGVAIRKILGKVKTSYVILLDADLTYPVQEIPHILKRLVDGWDAVVCSRRWKIWGSMPWVNRFGNWALSLIASILYWYRVEDFNSGMWGFKTSVVQSFYLTSKGFTLEADFFTNVILGGHSLVEVPISYYARMDGSKAKLKFQDGFRIGFFLLKKRFAR